MGDDLQRRLRHVFPRVDVLAVQLRIQLSELLSVPGRAPAILAEEIVDLPLPAGDGARQALRLLIEKGLVPSALAQLRTLRLADVVPLIGARRDGPLNAGCSARLRELLAREEATTWDQLGARTVGDIARWRGMGPLLLAGLVGAAMDAAMATGSAPAEAADKATHEQEPDVAALALLLRHDKASGGELRRALEAQASGDGPADVRAAATRLLAAADQAGDPNLALLDQIWKAAGSHRDRAVLAHRALRLEARPSAKELAAALALSESRINRVLARAEERARHAADGAGSALGPLVGNLGARLGAACRLTAVDDALAMLGLPSRSDPRACLLVWLAGPYVPVKDHAGWLATDPATLLADTGRLLHDDGGVRQLDHVAADLEDAGVAAHDVEAWLGAQAVAVVDGLVVALSGSPADVAERLLSAAGRALAATELAAIVGSAAAIDQRLRRDRRFVEVERDRFELAEWGGVAFAAVAAAAPAPAPPAELFPRTGRSQLRVEVDGDVLRGASEPVPLAVVEALGLSCGSRRTFTTRFGPVVLSHTATQATRGSVRPVALALGATAGDVLLLEFDAATGVASVEFLVAASSAAS